MPNTPSSADGAEPRAVQLHLLTPAQIKRIDELLVGVGEYGEVQLVVQHGQLRYINQVLSYKAWDESTAPKK